MKREIVAILVVVLFFGLALAPSIYAYDENKVDMKEVFVYEYKSDGSIEKNIIKLTIEEINKLHLEIKSVDSVQEKLDIYKKFNLISKDITVEKLEGNFNNNIERLGIDKSKYKQILNKISDIDFFPRTVFNFFCMNDIGFYENIRLTVGTSIFTTYLNYILWFILNLYPFNIPSLDIVDFGIGSWGPGIRTYDGLLNDDSLRNICIFPRLIMIGFIGLILVFPPIPLFSEFTGYLGFSVFTYAKCFYDNFNPGPFDNR